MMDGKKGIVFGVANDRSYAWHIARALHEAGAELALAHLPGDKNARRAGRAVGEFGLAEPWLIGCDVGSDEDLDATFAAVAERFGTIDFLVHSVAFADKSTMVPGSFQQTSREAWSVAQDISAYSLVAMARRAAPLMPDGGSIVAMSYLGGELVVPGYNLMGAAKASLEAAGRYLALELGAEGIRVNCISGGPLRTLSSMAIDNIDEMFAHHAANAPLQRNITGQEVGQTALFLLSDMGSGVTGEVLHVDAGLHALANMPCRSCTRYGQAKQDGQ